MIKKIKSISIQRTFLVTYFDGTKKLFKDTDISDEKLTDRQYLYALEFNVRHDDIHDDSQRMLG